MKIHRALMLSAFICSSTAFAEGNISQLVDIAKRAYGESTLILQKIREAEMCGDEQTQSDLMERDRKVRESAVSEMKAVIEASRGGMEISFEQNNYSDKFIIRSAAVSGVLWDYGELPRLIFRFRVSLKKRVEPGEEFNFKLLNRDNGLIKRAKYRVRVPLIPLDKGSEENLYVSVPMDRLSDLSKIIVE